MSRAVTHRTSQAEYDGKICYVLTAQITASAATVAFGHFVAPCDGTIREAGINTVTAPTHGTSDIKLGTAASTASLYALTDWQNHATGYADITGSLASATITKGEAYQWTFVGGDTTGDLRTLLVIEPR